MLLSHTSPSVAEVVPLKQGLKQNTFRKIHTTYIYVAEVVPLKQGLKPAIACAFSNLCLVAEVVPLKQGLKLIVVGLIKGGKKVAEVVPLKQGLKQKVHLPAKVLHSTLQR